MDESFNQWRNTQSEEGTSDVISEDDSDLVDDSRSIDATFQTDSKSGAKILLPDSDEEVVQEELTRLQDKSKYNCSTSSTGVLRNPTESLVVSSSSDEEEDLHSISKYNYTNSSPVNKKAFSLLSRKEEIGLVRSPITPLARNTKKKKGCILVSDESSENESNFETSFSSAKDVYSSTKLGNMSSSKDSSASSFTINKASINSENQESVDLSNLILNSEESETKSIHKNDDMIEDSESEEENNKKEVIVINSNSESEDLSEIRSSSVSSKIIPKACSSSIDLTNVEDDYSNEESDQKSPQNNEFISRLDSLKLEQQKLQLNVFEVIKDIECIKITLRSSNVTSLPDRGVRLQMKLKQQEAKLRDLKYQQGTLDNEILKLQISSRKTHQSLSVAHKNPQPTSKPLISKLPTSSTDVNAMGKKALETHRVQQALTVDALRGLHSSLKNCPEENTLESDPKGLLVELMPHQKHGLAWLMWREKEKPSGGILADDMGLGKTLTMIALILKTAQEEDGEEYADENSSDSDGEENTKWLSSNRSNLKNGNTLVVCPATLLGQWEGEIKNKLKRNTLSCLVHHGPNREKKARKLAEPDVVITTYNIVSRDASANSQSPLFGIRWRRIILDEAHQIRNQKTQTAKGVFLLKGKSRWALTGTPVHNKELDLYALLKFLRCKPFDDLLVWKRWVDNKDAAGLQRLTTITKSLMLRRTKEGLQQKGELNSLTDKTFHNIFVTMDSDEKLAYEKLLNFSKTLFAQFLHQKAEKENALTGLPVASKPEKYLKNAENPFEEHPELARLHKQMTEINDIKTHTILVLILRLRQFCCQPALIKTMLENEEMKNVGIEDNDGLDMAMMDKLTRMSLKFDPQDNEDNEDEEGLTLKNPLFDDSRLSTKLKKVLEKLEEILLSNDKIIVVSQWVTLLEVMYHLLKAKDVRCAMLTGKIPVPDRAYIVEKFNNPNRGPRVLLLSLTAGGVGLNLVGANHLLLIDLHWNPQLERQAFDRIYRVGQVKDVHIYKFITSETIEESILHLQEKKLTIASNVLTGSSQKSKLSLDDLKSLFSFNK